MRGSMTVLQSVWEIADRRAVRVGQVPVGPGGERQDDRHQIASGLGQAILLPQGPLRIGFAAQHALLHEHVQPFRQHTPGDAEAGMEILEPAHAQAAVTHHHHCPAVTQHRLGAGHGTLLVFEIAPPHGSVFHSDLIVAPASGLFLRRTSEISCRFATEFLW